MMPKLSGPPGLMRPCSATSGGAEVSGVHASVLSRKLHGEAYSSRPPSSDQAD
jgi:hypothetical protein